MGNCSAEDRKVANTTPAGCHKALFDGKEAGAHGNHLGGNPRGSQRQVKAWSREIKEGL